MQEVMSNFEIYGYIALFFYSLGGGFIGIVVAGILSHTGELNIYISIGVAIASNFIGDNLLFYLGRYNKNEVLKYFKKHRRKLALSHAMIKKHGGKVIYIQKFLYGIKTLIPLAIGLSKYTFKDFILRNALASVLWGLAFGSAAYFAGAFLMPFVTYLYEHFYIAIVILILTSIATYYYLSMATKKR